MTTAEIAEQLRRVLVEVRDIAEERHLAATHSVYRTAGQTDLQWCEWPVCRDARGTLDDLSRCIGSLAALTSDVTADTTPWRGP